MSGEERDLFGNHTVNVDWWMNDFLEPRTTEQWLKIDLTVPQLSILFLLYRGGSQSMGQLAKSLGVKLSTVTGLVDHLFERHLVTREGYMHNYRLTIMRLTHEGQQMADSLYQMLGDT